MVQRKRSGSVKVQKVIMFVQIGILIGIFILVNIAFCNHIVSNKVLEQSGEEYLEREEYVFSDMLLNPQDFIEQTFCPARRGMYSVKIRLALNYSGLTDEFVLAIALCQGETVLQYEEVTKEQIRNWMYYDFEVADELTPGQEYTIRIRQLEGPNAEDSERFWISYAVFHAVEHVPENKSYYFYNGEKVEGEFEVCYTYSHIDGRLIAGLVIADTVFLTLCAVVVLLKRQVKISERVKKAIAGLMYFFLPLAAFLAVEVIVGNLCSMDRWSIVKNLLIYYLIFVVLSFAFRTPGGLSFAYLAACAVWGMVHYFVLLFRGRAFTVQDVFAWRTAATVADQYHYEITYSVLICLLSLLLLIWSCIQIRRKVFSAYHKIFIMLGVISLMGCIGRVSGGYLISTYALNKWDSALDYKNYGTMLAFASGLQYLIVEEPEGYSPEKLEAVGEAAKAAVRREEAGEVIPENIIFIMNESFADLEYLGDIATETDLLPFLHGMEENVIKGWTYVPVFGAGTSGSEYEALTGNTMAFLVPGSTAYQTNVQKGEQGIVSSLKSQGYRTVALHPYEPENWNREEVYSDMGFDEFLSEKNWGSRIEMLRWCASDRTAYDKIIELQKETDGKLFAFLVTMQNHGGYASEWADFPDRVKLNYERQYPQAEQYLALLQESDKVFGELVEYFRKVEEPTMLIMFGDHQAQIETEFYEELLGKGLKELSFEEQQDRYVTPFVIWTNYDMEEQYDVRMSTNYLGSYILRTAGLELTPYNSFLLNLWEKFPVVCIRGVCDRKGKWYGWSGIPEEYEEELNEYEILQYNAVYDRKNRVDEIFLCD